MFKKLIFLAASICMAGQAHASSRQDLQDRIDAAKTVLDQIMRADDKGIPWGLQIGGQSTDLVLVAVNDKGFQDLLKNKFKIGANASAAAGPVGRNGEASTDWKMSAELLTYSRTKGLFAGIDLDGTSVSQNKSDTDTYYGQEYPFQTVLKGSVAVPQDAVAFVQTVAHYFIEAKNQ
jgi:SH3 domain-containing YSC84-like protein 1